MRVLAHIHTFNDADIIEHTVAAVASQTRPPDGIVIVDNGSTDGTLAREFDRRISIVRHPENLGTSGSVRSGFTFAIENGFDWIWLFDADSVPAPDALANLLRLYDEMPPALQDQIGFLSCLPIDEPGGVPLHGGVFTRLGRSAVVPAPEQRYYPCDVTNWSGCLYRVTAVRAVGLPNPDYVLDWGEYEYAYRLKKAGYKSFMYQDSVLRHNIRGVPSLIPGGRKWGPLTVVFYELPPIRCYYTVRNTLYFAMYDIEEGGPAWLRGAVWRIRPAPGRPGLLRGVFWRAMLLTLNFALRPRHHQAQIRACLRGLWHGVTGNIAARY